MDREFEVGVVGAGYVGLVTGACLSHIGHRVTVVDKCAARVAGLSEGRVPIYEPGLGELVEHGLRGESLRFTTGLAEVVWRSDVLFIAVDTPLDEYGSADLSNVAAVARAIGRALAERALAEQDEQTRRGHPFVVVNKSTVPVGSGDYVSMLIFCARGARLEIRYIQTGSWSARSAPKPWRLCARCTSR